MSLTSPVTLPLLSAGNPAHRGHPGERVRGRGGAAEGGHRHLGARPVRRGGLRHGFKQRRARRLLTALSSSRNRLAVNIHAHTYTHLKGPKQTRATGGDGTLVQWTLTGLVGRLKHSFSFCFFLFSAKLLHIVP